MEFWSFTIQNNIKWKSNFFNIYVYTNSKYRIMEKYIYNKLHICLNDKFFQIIEVYMTDFIKFKKIIIRQLFFMKNYIKITIYNYL